MKIPHDISLKLQRSLRVLAREDWSLSIMLFWRKEFADNPTSRSSIFSWQQSVDFILRCQTSGVTKIMDYGLYKTQDALFDDLRKCNPFVRSAQDRPGVLAWHGPLVYGTKELEEIVDRFFHDDDEYATSVNIAFVGAIEKVFADAGLPWTDKPLLPVIP